MSTNTNSSLTSKDWLAWAQGKLKDAGIATARLDCLVLLEDAIKKDRSYLLAESVPLDKQALSKLNEQIERRAGHEPLAYIRGKSEFYGREFIVLSDTLEPRPETETMVKLLKQQVVKDPAKADGNIKIIDVGTGSGCLAITAKLEIPAAQAIATDISVECIKIARQNANKLGTAVDFYQGDLLSPIPSTTYQLPTTILANLPYVPDAHTINQAAMHEPKIAIFGGHDGLDVYRRMFAQISELPDKPAFIFTESLPFQHKALALAAKTAGYKKIEVSDFIQVFSHK